MALPETAAGPVCNDANSPQQICGKPVSYYLSRIAQNKGRIHCRLYLCNPNRAMILHTMAINNCVSVRGRRDLRLYLPVACNMNFDFGGDDNNSLVRRLLADAVDGLMNRARRHGAIVDLHWVPTMVEEHFSDHTRALRWLEQTEAAAIAAPSSPSPSSVPVVATAADGPSAACGARRQVDALIGALEDLSLPSETPPRDYALSAAAAPAPATPPSRRRPEPLEGLHATRYPLPTSPKTPFTPSSRFQVGKSPISPGMSSPRSFASMWASSPLRSPSFPSERIAATTRVASPPSPSRGSLAAIARTSPPVASVSNHATATATVNARRAVSGSTVATAPPVWPVSRMSMGPASSATTAANLLERRGEHAMANSAQGLYEGLDTVAMPEGNEAQQPVTPALLTLLVSPHGDSGGARPMTPEQSPTQTNTHTAVRTAPTTTTSPDQMGNAITHGTQTPPQVPMQQPFQPLETSHSTLELSSLDCPDELRPGPPPASKQLLDITRSTNQAPALTMTQTKPSSPPPSELLIDLTGPDDIFTPTPIPSRAAQHKHPLQNILEQRLKELATIDNRRAELQQEIEALRGVIGETDKSEG